MKRKNHKEKLGGELNRNFTFNVKHFTFFAYPNLLLTDDTKRMVVGDFSPAAYSSIVFFDSEASL